MTVILKVDKLYIDKKLYTGDGSKYATRESTLNCLSWNIEGFTEAKRSSSDFLNILKDYDIICLSETWTNKNSNIDLKGYSNPIHSGALNIEGLGD